jgi:hypothetical protein
VLRPSGNASSKYILSNRVEFSWGFSVGYSENMASPLHLANYCLHKRVFSLFSFRVPVSFKTKALGPWLKRTNISNSCCKTCIHRRLIMYTATFIVYCDQSSSSSLRNQYIYKKENFTLFSILTDNEGHPAVETRQVWPFGWFQMWFCTFLKKSG